MMFPLLLGENDELTALVLQAARSALTQPCNIPMNRMPYPVYLNASQKVLAADGAVSASTAHENLPWHVHDTLRE